MRGLKRKYVISGPAFAALAAFCAVAAVPAQAQQTEQEQASQELMLGVAHVQSGTSYQNDLSLPLYYLPAHPHDEDEDEGGEAREAAAKKVPSRHSTRRTARCSAAMRMAATCPRR